MGARHEVLAAVAERYRSAGRSGKGRILDELCATTGWDRGRNASRSQETISGIGVISATVIATIATDPHAFKFGRECAAWIDLVPRQHSTGSRKKLGASQNRVTDICAGC